MNDLWIYLATGVLLVVTGIRAYPHGAIYKGVQIPGWAQFTMLLMGIVLICMSIWGLRRGEGKEKSPTDEDIRKAREVLERMHLREHGALPDYTQSGHDERNHNPDKSPPTDKP